MTLDRHYHLAQGLVQYLFSLDNRLDHIPFPSVESLPYFLRHLILKLCIPRIQEERLYLAIFGKVFYRFYLPLLHQGKELSIINGDETPLTILEIPGPV